MSVSGCAGVAATRVVAVRRQVDQVAAIAPQLQRREAAAGGLDARGAGRVADHQPERLRLQVAQRQRDRLVAGRELRWRGLGEGGERERGFTGRGFGAERAQLVGADVEQRVDAAVLFARPAGAAARTGQHIHQLQRGAGGAAGADGETPRAGDVQQNVGLAGGRNPRAFQGCRRRFDRRQAGRHARRREVGGGVGGRGRLRGHGNRQRRQARRVGRREALLRAGGLVGDAGRAAARPAPLRAPDGVGAGRVAPERGRVGVRQVGIELAQAGRGADGAIHRGLRLAAVETLCRGRQRREAEGERQPERAAATGGANNGSGHSFQLRRQYAGG